MPAYNTRQKAQTTSVPAPIGGLNARDSLAAMPPTDALVLDNYFPTSTQVELRAGSTAWVTGITGWVETLAHYNSGTTSKLFGVAGGKVYDVTASGAVGAAVKTGLSNSRFQTTNIGTPGGQFLVMVNGADKLIGYTGSSWWQDGDGTKDITGVNSNTFIHVNLHKNRLWFIEKNSMRAWYLATQSIAGAAQSIDLSTLFRLGGSLNCMASWTVDNAGGIDDYAAFITDMGEVAIYRGYDPNLVSSWALVGIFRIGRPQGRRCFARVGSDMAVITADGLTMLSKALLTDRQQLQDQISYKITQSITNDVQAYAANFGWQIILYPIGNQLILNVPQQENSLQYQYVMNTITGAWCTYGKYNSQLNAACWEILQDNIFFGTNGAVYKANTGQTDNGIAIVGEIKTAFNYFGDLGRQKYFTMVRPIFTADADIVVATALDVDYSDLQPTTPITVSGNSPLWDSTDWDVSLWGGAATIQRKWQGVQGIGYTAALRMRTSTKNANVSLQSIDYCYQIGGVL